MVSFLSANVVMLIDATFFQIGYWAFQVEVRTNIELGLKKLRETNISKFETRDSIVDLRLSIQKAMYGYDIRNDSVASSSRRSRSRESVTFLTESLRKALFSAAAADRISIDPEVSKVSLSSPLLKQEDCPTSDDGALYGVMQGCWLS